jgi:opacity protein-like surface antigen
MTCKTRRQLIFTFIVMLMQASFLGAQTNSYEGFSAALGAGVTRLDHDTLTLKTTIHPALTFAHQWQLFQNYTINAAVNIATIGGDNDHPILRYRNQYLGFSVGPRYFFDQNFFVDADLQYALLLKQRMKVLDGSSSNGVQSVRIDKYQSGWNINAGLGFQLQDGVTFQLRYAIPTPFSDFHNLQLMVSFASHNLKIRQKGKKYKDIETAISSPNDCRRLILHRKGLSVLQADVLSELKNLEDLFLDGNHLTSLPPEIGDLEYISRISARNNKIAALPVEIGNLSQLKELYLDYNQLTRIPEEIGLLRDLRFLTLSNNYLTELPAEIGDLFNLRELDVSNNMALLTLPIEMEKLRNLELLIVDPTTIFPIPFNLPNARLKIIVKN